jgi:type I restriction enzyme S subunit
MTNSWRITRLGDLVTIKHGWAFKSEHFSEERAGRPIIVNVGNFDYSGGFRFDSTVVKEYSGEYPSEYNLHAGDMLLVMTCQTQGGEILGIPASVPNDGKQYLHNQRLGKVVLKTSEVSARYLYWLFLTPAFNRELVNTASGTKILHTAPSRIEAFKFRLPPLHEQMAIASVLDALDNKIDLNRKMSATLEAIARALFKSWFIDFDPVRAKAEGRDPGLPTKLATLFPDSLTIFDGCEIPFGWHAGTAAELFLIQNGYAFRSKNWLEAGVPVVKIGSVKPGLVDLKAVSYVSEDVAEEASRFRLRVGDMLIGMTGYVGEVGLVPPTLNPPLLNQRVGKITARDRRACSPFAYSFFRLPGTKALIEMKGQGSAQANVSAEGILSIPMIVPAESIRNRFDNICDPLMARVLNGYGEISSLFMLRDTLLPKLMSGELRVSDAERILAESA